MAWSASMMFSDTFVDVFQDVIAMVAGTGSPNTFKIALFDNTVTPADNTSNVAYGVSPWNSGEVDMGTSPWDAGGVDLSSFAISAVTGGIKFDASDVSVASTTLTGMYGCLIYDSDVSNRGLIAVYFGGSYSTSNGTLDITWDSSGIATIDLTPS